MKEEIKDYLLVEINALLFNNSLDGLELGKVICSLKALDNETFDKTFDYLFNRLGAKVIKRIPLRDWTNHLYHFSQL